MEDERTRGHRKRAVAAFAVAGLLLVGNIAALAAFDHDGRRGHGPDRHDGRDMPFTQDRDRRGDRDDRHDRDETERPTRPDADPTAPGQD